MAITSEQVKLLREKTGAGMMDCKKALEESNGDFEKAIEYLRKKGAATAQKRADRATKEGIIVTKVNDDNSLGIILEVNCETDFVARSKDFIDFASSTAELIVTKKPADISTLLETKTAENKSISQYLNDLMAKIGEKIEIKRFKILQSTNGFISSYTHMGNKIGVLVEFEGEPQKANLIGRDIAMQIAAMNPQFISRVQVPKDIIERELEIYRTQARNEGKPEQVLDKIASGRLEKYFQEMCLYEQVFIKDAGKTIKDIINEVGGNLVIKRYERYQLGDAK